MENTQETKAAVKNGVVRMVFAVISILLEVVVLLSLLYLAGQKAGWVYSAIRFLGAMVVLRIYGSHKTASIRMTWMLVILLIPIFGTALYVMIGLNGHTLKMRKRYEDIDKILFPMLPDGEKEAENARKRDGRLGGIVDYIRRNAGYPVYQNTKVEESWHEIRDVLAERVKAGVEVRVFYDDMGSLGFINTDFVKRTEEYGIQCRVFNPFAPGLNLFLNNRDHRKITVIDGKVGYTGGYNLANEYFHKTEPFGFWKDTGVRLEGDAVQSLTVTFLEMWNAISGEDRDDKDFKKYMFNSSAAYVMQEKDRKIQDDPKLSKERRESIAKGRETIEKNRDAYFEKMRAEISQDEKYLADTTPIEGSSLGFVQPYADTPMDDIHVGEDVYISMAESAQKYAWFITPYLIITDEMCHAFSLAARRGVDVRIITPGIPDKKLVYSLTRSYYNGLTRNGVRVFEFTPGFCHAKMSIADDLMATCGTINLDYRSLYHHFENGCLYADCDAVMDTKRDFEETFKQCKEVTEYYSDGRGAFLRLSQLLLRLAAPLM